MNELFTAEPYMFLNYYLDDNVHKRSLIRQFQIMFFWAFYSKQFAFSIESVFFFYFFMTYCYLKKKKYFVCIAIVFFTFFLMFLMYFYQEKKLDIQI